MPSSELDASLALHRERLRGMVAFRMDQRIRQRVDPSDVVQEAYVEAVRRFDDFKKQDVPFFVWLRFITFQKLIQIQKRHLGVVARDPRKELQPPRGDATSVAIVASLIGNVDSPARIYAKKEAIQRLRDALAKLDATDREILALRHFEQLKNGEVASVLKLSQKAASKRYFRALSHLRGLMKPFDAEDAGLA